MDSTLTLSTAQLATGIFTIVFLLALPIVATVAGHHWLKVGWRYAFYGAAVFLIFQVLTRVPIIQIVSPRVQAYVQHSAPLQWGWLILLALTAGIFEEVGRYLGFRVFFRSEEKTWPKAVMFGIGHGGFESLFVSGTAILNTVQLWSLSHGGLDKLAPQQRQQVLDQFAKVAAQPALLQLAGSWERIWAMVMQVAMAVIVLQVFTRRSLVWLWLAVAAHAFVDLASLTTMQLLSARPVVAIITTEALVGMLGLAGLWVIVHLHHPRLTSRFGGHERRLGPSIDSRLHAGGHA